MMGETFGVRGKKHRLFYDSGSTFIQGEYEQPQEVLYLHFMGLKRGYHWMRFDTEKKYDSYSFSSAGFRPWVQVPSNLNRCEEIVMGSLLKCTSKARAKLARSISSETRFRIKGTITVVRKHIG